MFRYVGCPVRYNGRMVFKRFPKILSPVARNPIRDRGMASVVARNTWTSLSKGQAISLTRCERPFGGYLALCQGISGWDLNPRPPLSGGSDLVRYVNNFWFLGGPQKHSWVGSPMYASTGNLCMLLVFFTTKRKHTAQNMSCKNLSNKRWFQKVTTISDTLNWAK